MIYQLVPKILRWMITRNRVYVSVNGRKGRIRALVEAPFLYVQIRDSNPHLGVDYAMHWTLKSIYESRWFNKSNEISK